MNSWLNSALAYLPLTRESVAESVFRSISAESVTIASKAMSEATPNADAALYSLYKISTVTHWFVNLRIWPDTDTAEFTHRPRIARSPVRRLHLIFGNVTRANIFQPDAPSVIAASSSSRPCDCISGMSSRATNGTVTKIVARTMPGNAK